MENPTWERARVAKGRQKLEGIQPLNEENRDFPGGLMVKNPSSNAGDLGLILDWGKIPHSGDNQVHVHSRRSARAETREKPCEP